MEWTNKHDVQLLIEMRASNLFFFEKGSLHTRGADLGADYRNSELCKKFQVLSQGETRD